MIPANIVVPKYVVIHTDVYTACCAPPNAPIVTVNACNFNYLVLFLIQQWLRGRKLPQGRNIFIKCVFPAVSYFLSMDCQPSPKDPWSSSAFSFNIYWLCSISALVTNQQAIGVSCCSWMLTYFLVFPKPYMTLTNGFLEEMVHLNTNLESTGNLYASKSTQAYTSDT